MPSIFCPIFLFHSFSLPIFDAACFTTKITFLLPNCPLHTTEALPLSKFPFRAIAVLFLLLSIFPITQYPLLQEDKNSVSIYIYRYIQMLSMRAAVRSQGRFSHIQENVRGPPEAIDVHHIIVQRNRIRDSIISFSVILLLGLLGSSSFLIFLQANSITVFLWSLLLVAALVGLLLQNRVKKESVIIMPAFGVQLETHYGSGRTICQFVPISKILKPVINECVTPVTCYWSLSLILHGKEELMLVFKELCPPLRMLLPVWKALCAATDIKESTI